MKRIALVVVTGGRALRLVAAVALWAAALRGAAVDRPPAPSDEACAEFGTWIADCIETGRVDDIITKFARDVFGRRVSTGLGYSAEDEKAFLTGLMSTLPNGLKRQFAEFASGHFLRVQRVGDEKRALLRVVAGNGAVNYMAFVCEQRPGLDGLRWPDAFTYSSGEMISNTARRMMLPVVAQSKQGALERLAGAETDYIRSLDTIQSAVEALKSGDFAKVEAELEKLPPRVKQERLIMVLRLRATQQLGGKKYLDFIQSWEAAFPDDPSLDLVSIDGDLLRKDFDSALKHIDRLAQRIGGDPYLDYLAGNVNLMAERFDDARGRARTALKNEPTLLQSYDLLLNISLKEKKFSETVMLLDEIKRQHPSLDLGRIVDDDRFADFRASETYRAWQQRAATEGPSAKVPKN